MLKRILSGALAGCLALVAGDCWGAVIATWTFETSSPTNVGPHSPEIGAGNASFIVVTGSNSISSPAGNGSLRSFSSNGWNVGEGFQFQVNTLGFQSIGVTWDQFGSATGPRDFTLQYSTDGTNFMNFLSYSLPTNVSTWSTSTRNASSGFSADLTAVTALNNASSASFRLLQANTISINGSTVGSTGTGRVDNVTISGTPIPNNVTAVPEPSSLAVLTLCGLGGIAYRRKRSKNRPQAGAEPNVA